MTGGNGIRFGALKRKGFRGPCCQDRQLPQAARLDQEGQRMTETDEQGGDPEIGVCHVCGKTFDTQLALSKHLMDEHEDDELPTVPTE